MEKKIAEDLETPDPEEKPKKYSNSRIVFENACIDRGLPYYDYENFEIPWE